MEEIRNPEEVVKLLRDAVLLNNGTHDQGLEVLAESSEKLTDFIYRFQNRVPMTIRESVFLLRELMEIFRLVLEFPLEMNKRESNFYETYNSTTIDNESLTDFINTVSNEIGTHDLMGHMLFSFIKHAGTFIIEGNQSVELCNTLIDLGIKTMIFGNSYALNTFYNVPIAVGNINKMVGIITKKQSTANARQKKVVDSINTQEKVRNIFEHMKTDNPKITKNEASRLISKMPDINRAPEVIRRYLNNV